MFNKMCEKHEFSLRKNKLLAIILAEKKRFSQSYIAQSCNLYISAIGQDTQKAFNVRTLMKTNYNIIKIKDKTKLTAAKININPFFSFHERLFH